MNQPTITYYLPLKREQSKLQQVKNKYKSFTQANKEGIPKDLEELKLIKLREHAIAFLELYMDINKKVTKSQYCKTHHISHNSLNKGLNQLGHKTRVIETKPDQSKPIKTKQVKTKPKSKLSKVDDSISAGYADEELNNLINNSLANMSIKT